MMKFYQTLSTLALITFLCTSGRAQDVVVLQDFETSAFSEWTFTNNPATYNTSGDVWADVTTLGPIDNADSGSDFWGMRDLNNGNGGGNFDHTLTFDGVSVAGKTAVTISFAYNVVGYDGPDDLSYELFLDGVGQGEVFLIEGASGGVSSSGWETVTIPVDDAINEVAITIIARQDGASDYAGVDNFRVTENNPADPCGISSFGPAEVICITENPASGTDLFRISIPYQGLDADAALLIEAGATTPANDVTATTNNVGDDPTAVTSGTIILENTNGEFEEGDEVRVTLTDAGGTCSFVENISTTENQCNNPCDLNVNPGNIVFICEATTDGNDAGSAIIPFTNGPEPGAVITVTPSVTIGGDDVTSTTSGDIILEGLTEGTTYSLTIQGGGCVNAETLTIGVDFMAGTCVASDLVINEVNYDPYAGDPNDASRDANGDGVTNGTTDEFIEFFNTGTGNLDISGYTFEDNAGVFLTTPAGSVIAPANGFVVFAQPPATVEGCTVFGSERTVGASIPAIGLNNNGDYILVKNTAGEIVASFNYVGSSSENQSLARSPDFVGAFTGHNSIATNPVPQSACEFNTQPDISLPIDLLHLGAAAGAKNVEVQWTTANEVANDYFEVQRSHDGTAWTTLSQVPAADPAGRSTVNHYAFVDEAPRNGTNYYRLRQVDLDGTATLYGPVTASFQGIVAELYPNPAGDVLYLGTPLQATDRVQLLTADGRLLRQLLPTNDAIEVADLKPGLYLLRVERATGAEVLRFVKR